MTRKPDVWWVDITITLEAQENLLVAEADLSNSNSSDHIMRSVHHFDTVPTVHILSRLMPQESIPLHPHSLQGLPFLQTPLSLTSQRTADLLCPMTICNREASITSHAGVEVGEKRPGEREVYTQRKKGKAQ